MSHYTQDTPTYYGQGETGKEGKSRPPGSASIPTVDDTMVIVADRAPSSVWPWVFLLIAASVVIRGK